MSITHLLALITTQTKPRGVDAVLNKMADNDHIKLDNIEIRVYIPL